MEVWPQLLDNIVRSAAGVFRAIFRSGFEPARVYNHRGVGLPMGGTVISTLRHCHGSGSDGQAAAAGEPPVVGDEEL